MLVSLVSVNSFRSSDAIWRYKSGSTFAQAMACFLIALTHCTWTNVELSPKVVSRLFLYPLQLSWKWVGGWGGIVVSPCPSVRHSFCRSVCGQNRVRFASSTILAGSISYLHILSSNLCFSQVKNLKFWQIFKFVNLTLSCFYLGSNMNQ